MVKDEVVYDFNDISVITRLNQLRTTSKPTVVLTFDDGPGKYLLPILDILKTYNTKATFFWQTRLLYSKRPWKRLIEEGHTIGTHTINHPNLSKLSFEEQYNQIYKSKGKIEAITGQQICYFRPPFGVYNEITQEVISQLNLIPVLWSITSFDWELKKNPTKIIENVTENLHDGGIILLHELEQTVKILPQLIEEIQAKGYDFSTL